MSKENIKIGRKRVLSDEERIENKKRKDARIIKFSAPDGFKEILKGFAEHSNKDLGALLTSLIKKDESFIRYKTNLKQ